MLIDTRPCWHCYGPPPLEERAAAVDAGTPLQIQLCAGHLADAHRMMKIHQDRHPDDRCTDTCGCVSLEELRAKYGENFERVGDS